MSGLKKFAWRLTSNKPDAEDLLQSTVLRALEKKHLFQNGTNLFKWTSKIMFNQFITQQRRRNKFESQYDPQPYIDGLHIGASQEKKIEFAQVGSAISALSDEHRQILYLICINGMKYKDVAEKLDIPVGTVRSRLSRAREQLRLCLDNTSHLNS